MDGGKKMELVERNKRIYNLFKNKMNYMFKEVLTQVEKETKQFNVNTDFFKKPSGFYAIRKTLFDHGNSIIELMELILSEVEVTPLKSIINIDKKLLDEVNKKNDSSS